ncbi:cytochrome b [Sediminicoccus sp. KRV36]|uniref:cytochrome b n=1 Tax=Sediminicoccus sp. KRV36 TaxID=3133721 RepID=UPI00201030C3|nr:cytochrome b [Sediminicoccus rosea]UPY35670.1 cytochrome b [Sediminicoccus rosea]
MINRPADFRHDAVTQGLHWLVALAILLAYGSSLIMDDWPRGAFKAQLLGGHVALGLTVLGLTALRILWRALMAPPAPPDGSPGLRRIARAAHLALYLAMLAVPLLGLLMMWSTGREVSFLWLFTIPSPLPVDRALGRLLAEGHELAAHGLILLAGLHAAAAIFHQFALKDGLMQRMMPRIIAFKAPGGPPPTTTQRSDFS